MTLNEFCDFLSSFQQACIDLGVYNPASPQYQKALRDAVFLQELLIKAFEEKKS